MTETIYILMMTAGVLLFALGGTELPGVGRGFKWIRRFLLPAVNIGLIFWLGEFAAWRIIASQIILCGALILGYGETKPYWYKFLVGIAYVLPSLFFGVTWWLAITPVTWILLFVASNRKGVAIQFPWKIVEGAIGFCIQVTLIAAINSTLI